MPAYGAGDPRLVRALVRRPWWWVGTLASVAGLGLQVLALALGSIIVVQTVMTSSIVFTTVAERLLTGRRPRGTIWPGAALTGLGLVGLLVALDPTAGDSIVPPGGSTLVVAAGCLVVMAAAVAWSRSPAPAGSGRVLALAAVTGLGYGVTAVQLKTVGAQLATGLTVPLQHPALYVAIVLGPSAILLSQAALQQGRLATAVVSVILVVDPLVGLAAGLLWFGETVTLGADALMCAIVLLAGFVLTQRGPRARRRGQADSCPAPGCTGRAPEHGLNDGTPTTTRAGSAGMSTTETTGAESAVRGLSAAEAEKRRRRGEANTAVSGATRSYATILRTNVFSFFNVILFVIGVALLALGRYSDALISVGLGLINAVISATQEIRAKGKLDRLQLLDRTPVRVMRDEVEVELAPDAVVCGDVLRVRAGDQIVVDGPLLHGGAVEADESLLTGESDPVVKQPGDDLRSGSLCVAGDGHQLARDVGAASYAGRLTADARRTTTDSTPLERRIAFVVRLVMVLTVLMSGAILAQALLEGFTLVRIVQITAVLSGLVPYGLFFLIAVAYTTGAARIAGSGALVQQVNAVESVSNVDVVCTDKTGTLTTGHLRLKEIEPVAGDPATGAAPEAALGAFAAAVTVPNLTAEALAGALPAPDSPWVIRDEVPFASSLRWSGLATDNGVWVLGAPEALAPRLRRPVPAAAVDDRAAARLRVLVLARAADPASALRDDSGRPALPVLEPVAVVALADELRPDVAETITRFRSDGVALKVLSGDNPTLRRLDAPRRRPPADHPRRRAAGDIRRSALRADALHVLRAHRRELLRLRRRGKRGRSVVRRAQRRLPVPPPRPRTRAGAGRRPRAPVSPSASYSFPT